MYDKYDVLKQVLYFLLLMVLPVFLTAQQLDTVKIDSLTIIKSDTSSTLNLDSLSLLTDSVKIIVLSEQEKIQNTIKENFWLNLKSEPIARVTNVRKPNGKDIIFYTLLTLIGLVSFLRFFYMQYFNNLFRVFFNTSLRQSQLTDQLLQAKLQSLFFNLIFFTSGGIFIFFLLQYINWIPDGNSLRLFSVCSICLATIYFLKFITLKFTGWITGYKEITNIYIFIIFLINKILGILLIPLIIIIAFSDSFLLKIAMLVAIILIGLMFLLRIFRSYGLLQHQLKISKIHFFMYIIGIEILPVLLIYKGLVLLLSKNL